jgi:uncharacterized protein YhaN
VIRRKGNKDTLRGPDDVAVVEPAQLTRLLGGIDEEQFRQRFGIDREVLVKGGQDLLHGGGEAGSALFAAGTGLSDLRSIQARLKADAEELFKYGGSIPRINKSLSELDTARKTRREAQLRPAEWTRLVEELRAAEREKSGVVNRLAQARAEVERLGRLQKALPRIAKRAQLTEELRQLEDAPRLPADSPSQRQASEASRSEAERAFADATAAIAEIDATLAGLVISPDLLDSDAAIAQLQEDLGVHRKAAKDRSHLVAQRDAGEAEVRATLRALGREPNLEQAPSLQLTQPQRARIRELGREYQTLAGRVDERQRRLVELSQEADRCADRLQSLGPPRDTQSLRRAIHRARRAGDLEERLAAAEEDLRQTRRQADLDLQKLGLWTGPWETVESLPLPSVETADRFEAEFSEVDGLLRDLRREAGELQQRLLSLDAQIEELRLSQDALTEDDLTAARQRRDEGWQLVLQAWHGQAADEAALLRFIADFPAAQDLVQAYRYSVTRADEIADRLRRESAAVARKAQLVSERRRAADRQSVVGAELERQSRRREELEEQWRSAWHPAGISPLTPREMRAWLTRHAALAGVAAAIRGRTAEVAQLAEQIAAQRSEIARELAAVGRMPSRDDDTLADLLDASEQLVDRLDAEREGRQQLERDQARLREQLAAVQPEVQRAQTALTQWREQWAQAVTALALSADATPTEANEVAGAIDQLVAKLDKTASLRERIEGIDRDADAFAERVRQLTGRIAADLTAMPAERAVVELAKRLEQSQSARVRRTELLERRRREERRAVEARRRIAEANALLAELCRVAGCAMAEQLPDLERRAQQRVEGERELRQVEDQLLELAAGGSLADILTQAAQVDPDALPSRLAQLGDEVRDLECQRDGIAQQSGSLQTRVQQMDGGDRAAQAEEDLQSLLARIRRDAERYIRLRLAAVILERAIERYREKNQGPVLQRASQRFADLTLGHFSGLRADCNEQGQPVLVGVRPGGMTVGVEAMSEGARDQLYLALRLASLEYYLDQNPPLPFIVDDVLVHFDDERAAAALRTLGQLSDRTQVIFFTHHQHLVDLARQHVDSGRLFVHGLDCRTQAAAEERAASIAVQPP